MKIKNKQIVNYKGKVYDIKVNTPDRKYNINDVLCTEDLVNVFVSFDKSVNQGLFGNYKCDCGGSFLENILRPDVFTASGRYQRYTCDKCGAERRGTENLISKVDRPKIMKFSV